MPVLWALRRAGISPVASTPAHFIVSARNHTGGGGDGERRGEKRRRGGGGTRQMSVRGTEFAEGHCSARSYESQIVRCEQLNSFIDCISWMTTDAKQQDGRTTTKESLRGEPPQRRNNRKTKTATPSTSFTRPSTEEIVQLTMTQAKRHHFIITYTIKKRQGR